MPITQTANGAKFAPGHGSTGGAGLDVAQLFKKVLHRSYFILILLLPGIWLGHEALTLVAPRYTSTASILLDPKRPGSFGAESEFANLYVDSAKVAGVLAIMQSADLLERVVDSEHLAEDPEFAVAKPSAISVLLTRLHLRTAESETPEAPETRRKRAVGQLAHAIRVTRMGITYVVDVEATASTALKAQRLAQALVDTYLDDQTQSKAAAAQRDYTWLTARIGEVREDLSRSEEAVEAVRRKFGLAETGNVPGSTIDQQAVSEVNVQLQQAEADVASRRARYEEAARIRKAGGDLGALSEAVASRTIDDLRKQHTDIHRHLADLSAHYTAAYPELIQTQRDLQMVDSAINAETSRIVTNLLDEYEGAVGRRQVLADELARRTRETDSSGKSEGRVQLRDAQRIVDANRSLYNAFLGKLQDVEQQITRHDPEARILTPAFEPDLPSFPKSMIFLGGGAGLGMIAGLGLALLIPTRERGFVSIVDAEARLSLPILGAVPLLAGYGRKYRRDGPNIVDYLVTRSLSQFAECLRALRIALHVGSVGGPRIVQFTSAVAGEGKSSLAAALAVSAALSGIRTALIDADVRRPSISNLFGLQNCLGLTDILEDNVSIRDAIHKHRGLPLSIIPAGTVVSPGPDIIASEQFAALIKDVARDHDLVILDSPPVLAVSDPLVIAKVVDSTLLVVASQVTPKLAVENAMKALLIAKAPLVGVILNKANLSRAGRYSYGNGAYGNYGPSVRTLR